MELVLKIKKLVPEAVIPKFATEGSAGMDLTAVSKEFSPNKVTYGTGLAFEIPVGHVGLIFPRSSIHKFELMLTNCVGVLDSDYRGEVKFVFKAHRWSRTEESSWTPQNVYAVGDRVGQLVVIKLPQLQVQEVQELSSTERGEGGFGSTGR